MYTKVKFVLTTDFKYFRHLNFKHLKMALVTPLSPEHDLEPKN